MKIFNFKYSGEERKRRGCREGCEVQQKEHGEAAGILCDLRLGEQTSHMPFISLFSFFTYSGSYCLFPFSLCSYLKSLTGWVMSYGLSGHNLGSYILAFCHKCDLTDVDHENGCCKYLLESLLESKTQSHGRGRCNHRKLWLNTLIAQMRKLRPGEGRAVPKVTLSAAMQPVRVPGWGDPAASGSKRHVGVAVPEFTCRLMPYLTCLLPSGHGLFEVCTTCHLSAF